VSPVAHQARCRCVWPPPPENGRALRRTFVTKSSRTTTRSAPLELELDLVCGGGGAPGSAHQIYYSGEQRSLLGLGEGLHHRICASTTRSTVGRLDSVEEEGQGRAAALVGSTVPGARAALGARATPGAREATSLH
jgi:hypothetical protein